MRSRALARAIASGVCVAACFSSVQVASGATLPSGFDESIAFSGLTNPTVVRFASDGRVFVAEKSGLIKVFDGLSDPTPTQFADLSTNVYNFWDRGLLGMALHPNFPTTPYVYALYSYDAVIGGTAPRWGTPGVLSDPCPTPPGPTTDGCVTSGRLSRLEASGNVMTGPEQVLIEDWCIQYPSHAIGSLAFGPDGALYLSSGDGASFTFTDFGQNGNPCGDPANEGGALRSQDRRTSGDPVTLDGSILRVDPITGAALPDNPLALDPDPNARRIIASGLRNPFRIAFRPGTNELWSGDVGWNDWEELNLVANVGDATVENFGWPCYEGSGRHAGYDGANLSICENLYGQAGAVTAPYYAYNHAAKVVTGETCPTGSSSVSGLAFYNGTSFPASYNGALFFADYSRDCIWVMQPGADGRPNPATVATFAAGAANPVDVTVSPGGDVFYPDFDGGTIRRIRHGSEPPPPPPSCPTGQYSAQYYANMTLSGTPTTERCEPTIDYDWGAGTPAPNMPADGFSARWTGTFAFTAGAHQFTATADDGIRVWVDGTLLIDAWIDQAPTTYQVTRSLTAGNHEVKVEYYENGGGAVARLSWRPPEPPPSSCPTGEYLSQYYGNMTLSGAPVQQRCETAINYDWGTGSPGPDVPPEQFSTRWTGTFSFTAGTYEFTATADDGIRVWVDGALVIDAWVDQPPTTHQGTRSLPAGNHEVKVEYYENGGGAVARVSWSNTGGGGGDTTPPGAPTGLGASVSGSTAHLSWNAASDNVGVTGYNVHRSTTSGFVPSLANRVAQPTGTSYADAGLASGTYYYVVTAADAAGNASAPSGEATATVAEDKALGRPASASSVEAPIHEAAMAVDGSSATRWSSAYVDGQWWQVDLESVRAVDTVSLNWETAYASEYQILTSVDGTDFAVAAEETITSAGWETTSFAAHSARYVRVLGITRATPYGLSLWDAHVFGPVDVVGDASPPSAPEDLAANVVGATVNLSWGPANDNVGVTEYNVHRSTTSGFTPTSGNRIAQPTGTSYADSGRPPGTYYYLVTAEDAVGNIGPPSNQVTATIVNNPPTASIAAPSAATTWKVGDLISFLGSASDPEQGTLPASGLSWTLIMHHCPSNCHTHTVQTWSGVASGSFNAPDHDYPSHLELRLTATDSGGQSDTESVELQPETVQLSFATQPSGLQLVVGSASEATPFTRTVIVGSLNSVSAATPQSQGGTQYGFASWSDGGTQTHNIVAPATPTTYTATYSEVTAVQGLVAAYSFNEGSGATVFDGSGNANHGTISGATRNSSGQYGAALDFDGTNDSVTVPDSSSLDLTSGMTVEAWVRPLTTSSWRTVVLKERPGDIVYALYSSNSDTGRPTGRVRVNGSTLSANGTSRLTTSVWTHLATTFDGSNLRLYVNGALVGTRSASGTILTSTNPLRIGGSSALGRWFRGRIDEVRVYNRALSATEIQSDRNTPLSQTAAARQLAGAGSRDLAPIGRSCGSLVLRCF